MSDPLDRVLARPSETLTQHTAQVVERIAQLARLHKTTHIAYPRLWHRLYWSALLHDSGKLATGFQRGLRSRRVRWGLRHEVLSLAFVNWFDFDEQDHTWIIMAIATHHRDASFIFDHYRQRPDPQDDRVEQLSAGLVEADVRDWYAWLGHVHQQWIDALGLAGSVQPVRLRPYAMPQANDIREALAEGERWCASLYNGSVHQLFTEAVLLRGYMLLADHSAAAQAPEFRRAIINGAELRRTTASNFYPHQRACEQHSHQSVLLTAPTGSGKTEAALLWAQGTLCSRLIYMLPYRASMNAMAHRLERILPADQVGLQHGRALQTHYRRLLSEGHTVQDATQQARHRRNLARLHAYSARVFSPYHLMRAAYGFKGYEATLADLYASCAIVDEIHAYNPERLALVLETLNLLQARFELRLLMMTATLPPVVCAAINDTLPGLQSITASPHTFERFRRHMIHRRTGDLADELDEIAAAARGQAVLVTVNTVRRARQISRRLREMGANVLTLHGRFNGRDRWRHEQIIMRMFSAHTTRARSLPVVVSTQVIEVSLDVDFDVLFTDPAPLEALLQRFGRVNRARRQTGLAPVNVFSDPTGSDQRRPIYDPVLVQATLAVLDTQDRHPVDEGRVTDWLAAVYTPAIKENWMQRFNSKRDDFCRFVIADLTPFESADEGLTRMFSQLFDESEALPLTLEDEYRHLVDDDPLGAAALLVPMAYWQIRMLERQGRAWPEDGLFITDAAYDPEHGLQLNEDEDL